MNGEIFKKKATYVYHKLIYFQLSFLLCSRLLLDRRDNKNNPDNVMCTHSGCYLHNEWVNEKNMGGGGKQRKRMRRVSFLSKKGLLFGVEWIKNGSVVFVITI